MSPTLDHALALAAQGFHVFPLRPGQVKPAHVGWQNEATNDPDAIRALWTRDFNIGISTSHGLLVVDVDLKDGRNGYSSLLAIELAGKELPPTRQHATRSGGRHLFYRVHRPVKQGVDVLGPGLDIRSKGGYVVAPGSRFENGEYTVDNDRPIAPAPQWLIDACGVADESPPQASTKLDGIDPARAGARAVAYLDSLEPVSEGARNDAAFRVAAQIKDFGLDAPDCEAVMLEHWKCEPMLDELAVTIGSVYRNAKSPQGSAAPEAVFGPVAEVPAEPGKEPHYRILSVADVLRRPRPTWLVRGLLPQRGMAVIYGAPGSGKSFLALDVCAAIARGEPWGGQRVKPGPVVYVGLEGELAPRLAAYLTHHELKDVPGLRVIDRQPVNFLHERHQHIQRLIEDLKAHGPVSLVVIDTLNRAMPGGNENASEDMGRAIACAAAISAQLHCLCALVHHSGKDASAGARGHSSLLGAADAELEVSRSPDGHTRYVRATKVKEGEDGMQYSFHLESVDLGATSEHDPDAEPHERDASCVVADLQPADMRPGQKARSWTPPRQLVYDALRTVLAGTWGDENAPPACSVDAWQTAYFASAPLPEETDPKEQRKARDTRRKTFDRARDWLAAEKLVLTVRRKGAILYELGATE